MSMGQLSGASALHDAVAKGKLHLARFILDAVDGKGPVNSQYKYGKTPLLRAVRIENEQIRAKVMILLIKHLADVNAQDNMGRTPLSYACEIFHNDVVSLLVKNNVDPNLEDNNGNTPLANKQMVRLS
ncbi:putative ankyrin repeat domain-containing protein 26-like [Apostichopus japonicus]|uniref:Putative ankyrin repeat domain-containing protein 26-like n=1 Tax=Stichopus japonicus TaxID=307972 RepID=A0A2G8JIU8_STIJA|nr:putative ankyrin repeat domain-containing protein 26-like [Apostichopus japonicus]